MGLRNSVRCFRSKKSLSILNLFNYQLFTSLAYRHVAIMPYSLGGFQGVARTFFMGLLVLFHGLAFCFDGQAREFTRR